MVADAGPESGAMTSLRLRILATTDLHAHLRPYDYFTDTARESGGLAQLGGLIETLRSQSENCLLLDNGDTLQGTPLGDLAASEAAKGNGTNPMIQAMNALRYDAMALGNHDFNYGLDVLQVALEQAEFPVLSANLRRPDGEAFVTPSTILERTCCDSAGKSVPIKIGLVGLAPPQTLTWDQRLLSGKLIAEDIVLAAEREVADLKARGADLVILMSHTGLGPATVTPLMENAVIPLAKLRDVDAVIAGHTHQLFPASNVDMDADIDLLRGTIHGTPVVQPGSLGSHLGVIELELAVAEPGCWRVVNGRSQLFPAAPAHQAPKDLMRLTEPAHRATLSYIRKQIGVTHAPLHTYFALLHPSGAVQLINDAQRAFAEARLAHEMDLPLLSAAAPFKAGGRGGPGYFTDIPAGPMAIKNAADLYQYPNTLVVLKITGVQLREWLERAACAFYQIVPGQPGQKLFDHRFAAYNFDVIDGLTYQIDVTKPARYSADGEAVFETEGRIRDLAHGGLPVKPKQEFLIVTNSYRAAGGGHFSAPAAAETVFSDPSAIRDIIIRYAADQPALAPIVRKTWAFAPIGGTEVIVETGPGSLNHPATIEALGLSPIGIGDTGFMRFSMQI